MLDGLEKIKAIGLKDLESNVKTKSIFCRYAKLGN